MTNSINMNEIDIQTLNFRLESKRESFQRLINFFIVMLLCCLLFTVIVQGEISLVGISVLLLFGFFIGGLYWYFAIVPLKSDLVEQVKYTIEVKVIDKIHHEEFGVESWKIKVGVNEFGISIINIPQRLYDDILLFSYVEVSMSKNAKEILEYRPIKSPLV